MQIAQKIGAMNGNGLPGLEEPAAVKVFLAPMSGVTDAAMRRLALHFGAHLAFSEMVASKMFLSGDAHEIGRAHV